MGFFCVCCGLKSGRRGDVSAAAPPSSQPEKNGAALYVDVSLLHIVLVSHSERHSTTWWPDAVGAARSRFHPGLSLKQQGLHRRYGWGHRLTAGFPLKLLGEKFTEQPQHGPNRPCGQCVVFVIHTRIFLCVLCVPISIIYSDI